MATQRPSVVSHRGLRPMSDPISFQVTTQDRQPHDPWRQGAEQLLGKGDMLYMPAQQFCASRPFVPTTTSRVGRSRARKASPLHPGGDRGTRGPAAICSTTPVGGTMPNPAYRKAVQVVAESRRHR